MKISRDQRLPEPQDLVGPPLDPNACNTGNRKYDDLWQGKENCRHHIVVQPGGGGVKCTECGGWCCY